jgi:phosphopantothenoylcysteine decarboxylase/phosphopantothenate--cysteine ligase
MPSPANFKVVLGVTGGIAAYKACELVRLFKKAGHEVKVVMSRNAEKFVGPVTFEALSGNPVITELTTMSHIELAQWGDVLVVAPATANFLAKYSYGMADDALLTEALAFTGRVVIAPAMNTRMWDAAATQENVRRLRERGVEIVGPASGELACGEVGEGKMSEPQEVFEIVTAQNLPMAGKTVLVTSGPTRAYIDSIRYITNRSSGRMGHSVATEAERLGANVILVTGPVEPRFAKLARGKVIEVETADEMLIASKEFLPNADFVFAAAAVADFQMHDVVEGKIRREGKLQLEMEPAIDELAELGKPTRPGQIFVGFAAEYGCGDAEFQKAREKQSRKNLDLLAFNNVARSDIGFDVDSNEILLFSSDSEPRKIGRAKKEEVARSLLLAALEVRA